jgi:hypothetical protein
MGFDNGRIEARSSDEISLWLSGEKWHREHPAPPGYKSFSFTAKRRDLTPERLSRVHRALVKQALEFAWLDHGEDLVLDAEFDHARRIVLGGGHQGYISVPRNIQFGDDERSGMDYARLTRNEDGHPLLFIVARFWGVPLITDSLYPEPPQTVPNAFGVWTF